MPNIIAPHESVIPIIIGIVLQNRVEEREGETEKEREREKEKESVCLCKFFYG